MPATLEMTHGSRACILDNMSCSGGRVRTETPLKAGTAVILKFADISVFATVAWARGIEAGLALEDYLTVDDMHHIRWIADNFESYAKIQSARTARDFTNGIYA